MPLEYNDQYSNEYSYNSSEILEILTVKIFLAFLIFH